MGDLSRKIDMEKLISYGDDLVAVLKDKRDINNLTQCLENAESLRASSNADLEEVQSLLQDYEKRIDACKQKTETAKSEVIADEELDRLQQELEDELEKESLLLKELRVVADEINDLERKRISVQQRKQIMKKLGQDEFRAQRKLSMYASVTNIIPDLDDQSKISGHIVDRDKKLVQKFEFDASQMTTFDACDSIWKMIIS
ncbi:kinetochore protein SPC24 homolog [Ziziphus jujuba]|uniref:Kinetochore protein SPC24 homolog n=1 Tax=Ziziphus jujuba TaxID=326968 RepID=A0ABM4ACU7_ZIZJJ|nr:kinetochore protein SPC24 homolog [Ziziphus jujuba var. spinosa]XP_060674556.1 kinetochore protein SPC24 homolog [Ziziphus jujuba]